MGEAERLPLSAVADLIAPGQPLPFRVFDGAGRLLLAEGQVIQSAEQLKTLLERGASVAKEEAATRRRERAAGATGAGSGPVMSARTLTWFDRWEQQIWVLDALLRRVGRDAALAGELTQLADDPVALIGRQIDAALFVCVRQDGTRGALYAQLHALHCATVVWLSARQLGWPSESQRSLVCAALTMNTSIVELQGRMAEQRDPPTKGQIEQIRVHPQRSAEMLRASGVADEVWLTAVQEHHERAGPDGYPRGNVEPGEPARLLRAADVFTAKISPRALRAALPVQKAARDLFQQEGGGPIAAGLIKAVGVYPPGDLVRLKNGEVAIVVQRAAEGRAAVAAALRSAQGKSIAGAPRRDTGAAETAIAGPLAERAGIGRVLPEAVYGLLI